MWASRLSAPQQLQLQRPPSPVQALPQQCAAISRTQAFPFRMPLPLLRGAVARRQQQQARLPWAAIAWTRAAFQPQQEEALVRQQARQLQLLLQRAAIELTRAFPPRAEALARQPARQRASVERQQVSQPHRAALSSPHAFQL